MRAITEAALGLLSTGDAHGDPADMLRVRGMLCRLLGMVDEARRVLDEGLRLVEGAKRDHDAVLMRLELALVAAESRDLDAVRRHLKAILDSSPPPYSAGGL